VFLDKRFPLGALFIAPIYPEVYRKTDGATHIMTGDRVVCEGIGVIAVIVMAIDIVEETPHVLTQGIIEDQQRVSLRTAYLLGLLKQILNATVVYTIVKPWRFGEEAGEVRFVSTLEHTAGDVRQAFVVKGNQTCQVMLEMLKLAPILKEVPEDISMRGHKGSGSHDRQLHQALPFHGGGRIGPESIILKSEMANHNRQYRKSHPVPVAWSADHF
jgi:hypothetical protein